MAAGKSKKKDSKKGSASAEILESAHNIWLAGLGSLRLAEEEGGKLFRNLVEKGREVEARLSDPLSSARTKVEGTVRDVRGKASAALGSMEQLVDEHVVSTLGRLGVPTKDEIYGLTRRVEELTRSVLGVEDKTAAKKKPASKGATRKTTTKKTKTGKTATRKTARKTTG